MMTDNRVQMKYSHGVLFIRLMLLLLTLGHSAWTMADFTLPVTANIVEGTCEVVMAASLNGAGDFRTDNEVDVNATINEAQLLQGGVMVGTNFVKVALAGCLGSNSAGKTPVVRVTSGGGVLPAGAGYIFKPTTTTADARVGVVMLKAAAASGDLGKMTTWTPANYVKPGDAIPFAAVGVNGATVSTPLEFVFGLSCGNDATACGPGKIVFGDLSASVMLAFEYS